VTQINVTPIDSKALYQSNSYTDNKAGTIIEQVPVSIDDMGRCVQDPVRSLVYSGMVYLNNQPVQFPIPGASLAEACLNFVNAVHTKVSEMEKEIRMAQLAQPMRPGNGLIIDQGRKR
jgi:hypothetical protein